MNSDILDIPNLGLVSNNKKAKEVPVNIIYGKFGYLENNYKHYLASLKQGASTVPKGVYMMQSFFY